MKCLLFHIFLLLSMHPVHVTMTSVEYLSDSENVNVHVMMYYDDFLLDYKLFDPSSDLSSYVKGGFPESWMTKYVLSRLQLVIGERKLDGELVKMSLEDNEMDVDFVYKVGEHKGESLTVRNEFYVDLYADQANMTIISVDDLEEGVQFTADYVEKKYMVR
ncbi:MAG: hypothetical protein J6W61_03430 [Bacteroidales bacterium]|nr:hypothetical protein [Bacteroidales bacterium]MBP5708798.1 hypothetical protein [Bacteroidales bacterium]